MKSSGRLINVSNRLPVVFEREGQEVRALSSSGGLATALNAIWGEQAGIWIGWTGEAGDHDVDTLLALASQHRSYELKAVPLTAEEIARFYCGFANEIVWPLFHDMPSQCNFDPAYWESYEAVNRKFARAVAETAQPGDVIWVHDYHLILVGKYLRELGVECRHGFFQHIPFPPPDIFEKLPWRETLLQALLGFDVIGLQTEHDRHNLEDCLQKVIPTALLERTGARTWVRFGDRVTTIGAFPISIDFDEFALPAAREETANSARAIRAALPGNWLVLGVDRMDYTKGIPERLRAFQVLLERFPDLREQITLVQIVVPSRSDIPKYKDLRLTVERLVSEINGHYTRAGWVPIHYMYRHLEREELLAYYRAADIALLTPLKDGMNLVAKEFCAAQVEENGVLILSEFAGAGAELQHGAILVNPNDFASVAETVHRACGMSLKERRRRMKSLRAEVREHDVHAWARSFLEAIQGGADESALGPCTRPDAAALSEEGNAVKDPGKPLGWTA